MDPIPANLREVKALIEFLVGKLGNDIVVLDIAKRPDDHPAGCSCRSCTYDRSEDVEIDLQGNPIKADDCECDT